MCSINTPFPLPVDGKIGLFALHWMICSCWILKNNYLTFTLLCFNLWRHFVPLSVWEQEHRLNDHQCKCKCWAVWIEQHETASAGYIRWILAFISSRLSCSLLRFTCCWWLLAHLLLVFISRPNLLPPFFPLYLHLSPSLLRPFITSTSRPSFCFLQRHFLINFAASFFISSLLHLLSILVPLCFYLFTLSFVPPSVHLLTFLIVTLSSLAFCLPSFLPFFISFLLSAPHYIFIFLSSLNCSPPLSIDFSLSLFFPCFSLHLSHHPFFAPSISLSPQVCVFSLSPLYQ